MRSVRCLIVLMLMTALSAALHAQELVVHEKPVRLRHLSGIVVDSTGAGVAYSLIELRDVKDHHVVASTFGDAKGKFFFDDRKYGKRVEIRVSLAGFNMVQYSVVLKRFGQTQLRAVLPVVPE
jgi:hypothetical protein